MLQNFAQFWLNGENIAFFILSVVIITGAVLMISFTRLVHMVTALAFSFLGLAGLYVLLEAEFVAFVQVLVYAGAITILMIFGIMMTQHTGADAEESSPKPLHHGFVLVGVLALFGILFFTIQRASFPVPPQVTMEDNTSAIGEQLFTLHVIPFELVSVLITVAFIGAIIVAKREED